MFDPEVDTDIFGGFPTVPDKLIDQVTKHHSELRRIVLESKPMRGGRFRAVHTIELELGADGGPEYDPMRIATHAMRVAEAHAEESGDRQKYRAKLFREDGKRPTVQFTAGGDESDPADPSDINEQELGIFTILIDRLQSLLQIQNNHIEAQNTRILAQSEKQSSTVDPLLATIETLVQHYHMGLNMQANALGILNDTARVEKEVEVKSERDKALIAMLGAAMPKFFEQMGKYAGAKMEEKMRGAASQAHTTPPPEDVVDVTATETVTVNRPVNLQMGVPQQTPEQSAEQAVQEALQQMDDETRKKMEEAPLMTFAHTLRETVSAEQWLRIASEMTKRQMQAMDAAFRSNDDEETMNGILKLEKVLTAAPAVAITMTTILDKEQMGAIQQLLKTAQAAKKSLDAADKK